MHKFLLLISILLLQHSAIARAGDVHLLGGEFPSGWEEGEKQFVAFFRPVLKPFTVRVDWSKRTSATDAWITRNSETEFSVVLSATPFGMEKKEAIAVHELTHALHMIYRPKEEAWIQEGVALLSEYLVFHRESDLEELAYKSGETSLIPNPSWMTEEGHSKPELRALYGQWRLLFKFLHQECGGNALFFEILTSQSPLVGVPFIDFLLKNSNPRNLPEYCKDFDSLFTEFEIRKFTQDGVRSLDQSSLRGHISSFRAGNLEPYSADGYYLRDKCEDQDIEIDANTCLRLRKE